MPWVCLAVPPLLLLVMLGMGRIERSLGAVREPGSRRARGTVGTGGERRRSLILHHHRVRPAELGRSMRRMRYVPIRPKSHPRRKGVRERAGRPRYF